MKNWVERFDEACQGEPISIVSALRREVRLRHISPQLGCNVIDWIREDRDIQATGAAALPVEPTLQVLGTEELGSTYIDYGTGEAA